jgi:hypothetical protein
MTNLIKLYIKSFAWFGPKRPSPEGAEHNRLSTNSTLVELISSIYIYSKNDSYLAPYS